MTSHSQIKPIQLENKLGLTGRSIVEAETLFMTMAAVEGVPKGSYDLKHLQNVHCHAFGEMYSWAGELSPQVSNDSIARLSECLDSLASQDVAEMTSTSFAATLATHYATLQANDPFEHGGGRAIRFLIEAYAADHGLGIDWGMHSSQCMSHALEQALQGDGVRLSKLFTAMVTHQDLYQAQSEDGIALRTTELFQAAGLSEALVPLQSVIAQSDITELAGALSEAFKKALEASGNTQHPLHDFWDRTSILQGEAAASVPEPHVEQASTAVGPTLKMRG